MKYYNSFSDLERDYPAACQMIRWENELQYPNAKFVEAVVGDYVDPNQDDLLATFDVGFEGQVLFCWVAGDLSDSEPNRGSYIDEYYLMLIEDAKSELDLVQ